MVASESPATGNGSSCVRRNEVAVAKSKQLVVLTRVPRKRKLIACLRSTGHRRELTVGRKWHEAVVVARRTVAYADVDDSANTIVVIHRLGAHPARRLFQAALHIFDLVVRPSLAAAWLTGGGSHTALRAAPSDVPDQDFGVALDEGPDIDRNSLRLRGGRLSWRKGTETHHARLR